LAVVDIIKVAERYQPLRECQSVSKRTAVSVI